MPTLELSRTDAPAMRARALVFEAPVSRALLAHIEKLAPTDATVLITGETGTGKEIVARHLHDRSSRAKASFVAVNCGALTPSLLESELFGHERGAFTGAFASSQGWFEAADKGTLFLDEVGDLPLGAQVKLLRVLQEHEVVRVGARRAVQVDVRLIAATNTRLRQAVAEGRFREDLYYRLHVAHLALAPLRDRQEDILPLARHFLNTYATRLGIAGAELTEGAVAGLLGHSWPGNIRELENVVHRALLVARHGRVTTADLQLAEKATDPPSAPPGPAPPTPITPEAATAPDGDSRAALEAALLVLFDEERPGLHDEIEEIVFRTAYRFSDHNQLRTARLLGISRNVVRARLLQYGLLAPPSKPDPERGSADSPDSARRGQPLDQGCAVALSVRRTGNKRVQVRVGHQPFGVLSLLKATGALEEALSGRGVDVDWTDCATGMQVIDAIAAGALDIGVVGEAPPVFAQASRAPVVYLAAEPPAPEGEAIVVLEQSPIVRLVDLRGKTLAVSRGANVVYFVVRALEESGLTLDDVDVRPLSPVEARAAFARGEVDAWAIWNPILASLEHSLRTRVVRDARGLASNRAFYVGRRAFADAQPEIVEAFIGQVGAVGRWANDSRELAARMLAPEVGFPRPVIEAALARTPFDAQPLDAEAVLAQQRIADTFHELRLIARPVRVNEAVWAPPPRAARRSA
jgi:aliphatic sulfonates family ABC transporter substrate-binding protein